MSMNATFVQVDPAELSKFQADPSLAEALFEDEPLVPPAFTAMSKMMQDRVRANGPQLLAGALSRLDPAIRQQLEQRIGLAAPALAAGAGGDILLKMMEERQTITSARPTLSLDKAWHGVHYLLCGEVEPGAALLSHAVLGGVELGDDEEGFSGYGPARYFTAERVAEISQALSHPDLEAEAAARFDAARMSQLKIYPGWRPTDLEWVLESFRRVRAFYSDAAAKGRAIVTCLV